MASRPRNERAKNAVSLVLFCAPFLVGGIVVTGHGVREVSRGLASRAWPTAPARVTASAIGTRDDEGTTSYTADVAYAFTVDGVAYAGSRVRFGAWSGSQQAAQAVVRRYPVGAVVAAHYLAADPAIAVLETGAGAGAWIIVPFGLLFTAVGAGVPLALWLHERRRRAHAADGAPAA